MNAPARRPRWWGEGCGRTWVTGIRRARHEKNVSRLERCRERCTFAGLRPRVVISISEPYDFYRSLYQYAFAGRASSIHTKLNFESFMLFFVGNPRRDFGLTQAASLKRACGDPCRYDYVLRKQRLEADWAELLCKARVPRHSRHRLPHFNPSIVTSRTQVINFSAQVLKVVNRVDRSIFEQFGFAMRTEPFVLR